MKIFAAFISMCLFVMISLIGWYGVTLNAQHELEQAMLIVNAEIDSTRDQITAAHTKLRMYDDIGNVCSDEMLLTMRKIMFLNPSIKDMAYLPNPDSLTVVCSANLGNFDKSFDMPKEDLVLNGDRQWIAYPMKLFDRKVSSYVTQRGHFMFAIDSTINKRMGIFYPTSYYLDGLLVSGNADVKEFHDLVQDNPLVENITLSQCNLNICIYMHMTSKHILEESSYLIASSMVLGMILALLLNEFIIRFLNDYSSVRGRISRSLLYKDSFYCVYQPIVDIEDNKVVGCEVLARYQDQYGELYPDQFIPVIEELNKTLEFTDIIISKSLDDIFDICKKYDLKMSINFYPSDMNEDNLPFFKNNTPLHYASQNNINLNCEVLETGLSKIDNISEVVDYLHDLNFTIAIDDFGTGHSNLHHIVTTNAEILKIDKSFIDGLGEAETSLRSSLLPTIISIADIVQMKIIAEGAEREEQVEMLRLMGIRYIQGYYFSKPLKLNDFIDFTTNYNQ